MFTSFSKEFKFVESASDSCIFVCGQQGRKVILAIYVDDGLVAAHKQEDIDLVIKHLREEEMQPKVFPGMELNQIENGILLSQSGYTKKMLSRFNIRFNTM